MRADLILLIIRRADEQSYLDLLSAMNRTQIISFPCRGSTARERLEMLGLVQTENLMLLTMAEQGEVRRILAACVAELGLRLPGRGAAFAIPVSALGGESSKSALLPAEGAGAGRAPGGENIPWI